MDPDHVASRALRGMAAGRAVIVPGLLNQCLAALGRYVPRSVVCSVVSSFYGKTAYGEVAAHANPLSDRRQEPAVHERSYEPIHRRLGAVCDL
jgi:hypothetical protein